MKIKDDSPIARYTGTSKYRTWASPRKSRPGYDYYEAWWDDRERRYMTAKLTQAEYDARPTEYEPALKRYHLLNGRR